MSPPWLAGLGHHRGGLPKRLNPGNTGQRIACRMAPPSLGPDGRKKTGSRHLPTARPLLPLHSSNPLGEALRSVAAPLRLPRSRPGGLPQQLATTSLTTHNRVATRCIPGETRLVPPLAGAPHCMKPGANQCSSGTLCEHPLVLPPHHAATRPVRWANAPRSWDGTLGNTHRGPPSWARQRLASRLHLTKPPAL
jgi:hypothetical protein